MKKRIAPEPDLVPGNPDLVPGNIEKEVARQLDISADLSSEFSSQSAYFARWAYLHARAQDFVRKLEEQVEVSFYELYNAYRRKHSDAKENECKAHVRTHLGHKKLTRALRAAQFQTDILKVTLRAFEMRRDMLIQLGAQYRSELDGTDLKTKAKRATRILRESRDKQPRTRRSHGDKEE